MIDMHIYLTGEDSEGSEKQSLPRQDKTRLSDALRYHDGNRNWTRTKSVIGHMCTPERQIKKNTM